MSQSTQPSLVTAHCAQIAAIIGTDPVSSGVTLRKRARMVATMRPLTLTVISVFLADVFRPDTPCVRDVESPRSN